MRLMLPLALFLLVPPRLRAEESPQWQQNGFGPRYRRKHYLGKHWKKSLVDTRAGALGLEFLEEQPGAFPRLIKQLHVCLVRQGASFTADFGRIMPEEPGAFESEEAEGDWVRRTLKFTREKGKKRFHLTWSRLTPALLVETNHDTVHFFADAKVMPSHFAVGAGGECTVSDDPAALPLKKLEGSWLLAWAGEKSGVRSTAFPILSWEQWKLKPHFFPADCPFLFVFRHAPQEGRLEGRGGLWFSFGETPAEESVAIAVVPLFGEKWLPAEETQGWVDNGLPDEVLARCRQWAEILSHYPLSVCESYSYDAASDTITVGEEFTFAPLRAGGKPQGGRPHAPVPPMLSVAVRAGFPVEFSRPPVDAGYCTAFGPYQVVAGVKKYSWKVKGLGEYLQPPRAEQQGSAAPPELERELAEGVKAMLAAGHLAPWHAIQADHKAQGFYMTMSHPIWSVPGENLYYLCELLPAIRDEDLRKRLLEYIRTEREMFPPEDVRIMPPDVGARRERYRINPMHFSRIKNQIKTRNFFCLNKVLPWMNFYGLARYYEALPEERGEINEIWSGLKQDFEAYLPQSDWASLGWFGWKLKRFYVKGLGWDGLGGVADANRALAAAIGYTRLAKLAKDGKAETLGRARFALAAVLRVGLDKLPAYFYDRGLIVLPADPQWQVKGATMWTAYISVLSWKGVSDDPRRILRLDEFGPHLADQYSRFGLVPTYRGLVPESARLLREYGLQEAQTFADKISEHAPDWFLAFGEQFGSLGRGMDESRYPATGDGWNYPPPEDPYQLFLARAWILREPPRELAKYLDIPHVKVGDLYHLHKLAEAIKAYRSRARRLLLPAAASGDPICLQRSQVGKAALRAPDSKR